MKLFNITGRQANNYIKFFLSVCSYPRLLVCGKTFTEISDRLKFLIDFAENNSEFNSLLGGSIFPMKYNEKTLNFDDGFKISDFEKITNALEEIDLDENF